MDGILVAAVHRWRRAPQHGCVLVTTGTYLIIRHCKIGSTQVSLGKGSSRNSWGSVGAANGQCRSERGIPFMRLQQTSRHTGSRDRARRIQLQLTPENYALQTTSKHWPTNADDRPRHSRGSPAISKLSFHVLSSFLSSCAHDAHPSHHLSLSSYLVLLRSTVDDGSAHFTKSTSLHTSYIATAQGYLVTSMRPCGLYCS